MKWDKVKNFVIGGGLILVWGITLGFLDWRAQVHASDILATNKSKLQINAMIDTKLKAVDLGTDSKIVSMDTNIATNTSGVAENKEDGEFRSQQLRDVANVLFRRNQPPEDSN